jgi:hypothetical protein
MSYAYRITVQRLPDAQPDAQQDGGVRGLTFDVVNHDEIIKLVEKVRAQRVLPDEEAAAFTVGLKLFGETMLRHREEPLFADLFAPFGVFMKRLKAAPPRAAEV